MLSSAISSSLIKIDDSILVVCGGTSDKDAFASYGFKNVVITNLDYHAGATNYLPYSWDRQDAENLAYPDDTYDWVFVKAGLHHCASPHRGLCEMLRVSKKGVGVIEARDSQLMKIAMRFDLTPSFELEPVILSKGVCGGVRNKPIPNFIYRWTETEVKKTVESFVPEYKHKYFFFYDYELPLQRYTMSKELSKKVMGFIGKMLLPLLKTVFPKQGNNFAFLVTKKGALKPWLKIENDKIVFELNYAQATIDPSKYKR